jgi:hypothetical protein
MMCARFERNIVAILVESIFDVRELSKMGPLEGLQQP